MYIRKQPSGSTDATANQSQRGRGEYEISGDFESTPSIKPADLFEKPLFFEFGRYGYKPTGNVLRHRHGKKRVQLLGRQHMHGARQVQAALLFPKSRRDEHGLIGGRPTIMLERYIVRRMNFNGLTLTEDSARVRFGTLDLYNGSQEDAVDFGLRMREVEALHDNADKLPDVLRGLLREHRTLLEAPNPIPKRAEAIVKEVMDETARIAPDYNIDYVSGTDVLPPLREMANQPQVEEPIAIESIPTEDVEIRLREAAQWRRFVAVRGPAAAAFRRQVREAYDSRCIVCGIRLPASPHCRVPGVDSAHILPWATHDMDVVGNGLCLCKMHHWAFDQQLIAIIHEADEYQVTLTDRARAALDDEALCVFQAYAGIIPSTRLPRDPQHWPQPQFLGELYQLVTG
jgi:putative restriction endonuclease